MGRLFLMAMGSGLIALDFTGIGPFMLTQPIICGPLVGHFLGQTMVGLLIGGIVQLLWLDVTAVGVGVPFDSTAVTILATFWGTLPVHSSLSQIILALFIAVPFGFVFKLMDFYARRLNSFLSRFVDHVADSSLPSTVTLGIIGSLFWIWLRYAITFFVCMAAGQRLWTWLAYWPRMTRVDQGLTMAVLLLPVAGLGSALELFLLEEPDQRFHGWRPSRWHRRSEDPRS